MPSETKTIDVCPLTTHANISPPKINSSKLSIGSDGTPQRWRRRWRRRRWWSLAWRCLPILLGLTSQLVQISWSTTSPKCWCWIYTAASGTLPSLVDTKHGYRITSPRQTSASDPSLLHKSLASVKFCLKHLKIVENEMKCFFSTDKHVFSFLKTTLHRFERSFIFLEKHKKVWSF